MIATPTEFPSVLNASFDQIRQYGESSVSVSIRLLEALERIAGAVVREPDRQAVRRQAEMVVEGSRHQAFCDGDQKDIQERFEHVFRRAEIDPKASLNGAADRGGASATPALLGGQWHAECSIPRRGAEVALPSERIKNSFLLESPSTGTGEGPGEGVQHNSGSYS